MPSPWDGRGEQEKREKLAASKVRLAKQLADQGKADVAVRWLNDCIRLYPGTEAAGEAKQLLKKMKQPAD